MFLIVILILSENNIYAQQTSAMQTQQLKERAIRLLSEMPLIDGHNDLPEKVYVFTDNNLNNVDLSGDLSEIKENEPFQTDIPRLRQGHSGGMFMVAWVSPDLKGPSAVIKMFEQIDIIHRIIEQYPDDFSSALTAEDIERNHASGKITVLIGIENGGAIGNSLANLREAYNCGARYMTLTHMRSIDWADACDWPPVFPDQRIHGGLTPFGKEVVREMNRLGMMVDLSHVSDSTALDALDVSEAPVIFSHSGARAVCNHIRNVPDEILRLIDKNDGIVMVNFTSNFVSEEVRIAAIPISAKWKELRDLYPDDPKKMESEFYAWAADKSFPKATISELADHIDHIRNIAGIDHIGIGSDFDGTDATPVGLEDVSGYPELIIELLRRGYSDDDIKKITGGNILRVMRSVEEVSQRIRKERPASEAKIEELDGGVKERGVRDEE